MNAISRRMQGQGQLAPDQAFLASILRV